LDSREVHLDRGDFSRFGYLPGVTLRNDPPRLLLAALRSNFIPPAKPY
jgi:hypothetical protein